MASKWPLIEPKFELAKALGFTALAFGVSYGNKLFASLFDAPPVVAEMAVTLLIALFGFIAYSICFSSPQLTVTWEPDRSNEDLDTNPLIQPIDSSSVYVVKMDLFAPSFAAFLILNRIKKLDLVPSIKLRDVNFIKIVPEDEKSTGLQRGTRADGVKQRWDSSLGRRRLSTAFTIAINPVPKPRSVGGTTEVAYELRRTSPLKEGKRDLQLRLLNFLTKHNADVDSIKTRSFSRQTPQGL